MRPRIAPVSLVSLVIAGCGSAPGQDARALCSAYVACVGQRAPDQLVAVEELYGPRGACWLSGVSADTCAQQCADAKRRFVAVGFGGSFADCNRCASTPDCGGAQSLVCDTSQGQCVECLGDGDCHALRPVCGADHTCVGCTTNAQCRAGVCHGGQCCTPKTCAADACGDGDDGCGGTLHCGSCGHGSCVAGHCDAQGVPCAVGDATCLAGEACLWDTTGRRYVCAATYLDGMTCPAGPPPPCALLTASGASFTAFSCVGSLCVRNCLGDGECGAGRTCQPVAAGVPITPAHPGHCA